MVCLWPCGFECKYAFLLLVQVIMPRVSRSTSQLSDDEKKKRRREQKKLSMRRARAKMDEAVVAEVRRKDRERYYKKKENGEIKNIDQYTPREQR